MILLVCPAISYQILNEISVTSIARKYMLHKVYVTRKYKLYVSNSVNYWTSVPSLVVLYFQSILAMRIC